MSREERKYIESQCKQRQAMLANATTGGARQPPGPILATGKLPGPILATGKLPGPILTNHALRKMY